MAWHARSATTWRAAGVAPVLALGAVLSPGAMLTPAAAAAPTPGELAAQAAERAHDDHLAHVVIVLVLAPLVLTFLIEQATAAGWLPERRTGLWRLLDVVVMIGSALWSLLSVIMFVANVASLFRGSGGGSSSSSSSSGGLTGGGGDSGGGGATTRW